MTIREAMAKHNLRLTYKDRSMFAEYNNGATKTWYKVYARDDGAASGVKVICDTIDESTAVDALLQHGEWAT